MSLFTGNVYDKDGSAVDSKFKLYFVDIGKMSNDHNTEYKQFNIDTDDSDLANNGTSFSSGKTAVVMCWITGQCGITKVVSDGSDSYVYDMQMMDCQPPSTKISVSDGIIDIPVSAGNTSSDEYQWDFKGVTHYHKNSWFGKVWCDMVGIEKVEYDWSNGNWVDSDTHTFTAIGDYLIKDLATNKCGLTAEDSKMIRIRYPQPGVTLVSDPSSVIINEDTTISITTSDPYSRVIKQDWFMDGKPTDKLKYVFTVLGSHRFCVRTYWNDGFEDKSFLTCVDIGMKNQPPTIDMVAECTGEDMNIGRLIHNAKDPEKDLAYVDLKIYADSKRMFDEEPEEYNWIEIDGMRIVSDFAEVKFMIGGRYKMTMQAVDGGGLKSKIDEFQCEILCVGQVVIQGAGSGTNGGNSGSGDGSVKVVEKPVYVQIEAEQFGEILVLEVSGGVESPQLVAGIVETEVSGNMIEIETKE